MRRVYAGQTCVGRAPISCTERSTVHAKDGSCRGLVWAGLIVSGGCSTRIWEAWGMRWWCEAGCWAVRGVCGMVWV